MMVNENEEKEQKEKKSSKKIKLDNKINIISQYNLPPTKEKLERVGNNCFLRTSW